MHLFETILTRMMGDSAYADEVFRDPVKALANYNLPNEGIAKFKALSRADFESAAHEYRKLLATLAPAFAIRMESAPPTPPPLSET
ncbi:MAG: hypothetical protein HYZ21_11765 [Chloroflexi bacterium]|nr:hypothetical protein [Chloroflexota bacterium]